MALQLAIVTPEAEVLAIEADEVDVPGASGQIGFLPGHIPLITALSPGVLTIVFGGKKAFYAISTGFAEIEGTQVTVLTDSCEEANMIDVPRAKKALHDAEEKLKSLSPDEPSWVEQKRRADQAQARLNASERSAEHRPPPRRGAGGVD